VVFFVYQDEAIKLIFKYKIWIDSNILIGLIFLFIGHTLGCLIMVPGTLFALFAGLIFGSYFQGNIYGYFLCVFTLLNISVIAGMIPFFLARVIFKPKIRRYLIVPNKYLFSLDSVLKVNGKKALFFLRLSPILPVSLLNFVIAGFDSKKFNNFNS
jgi:uncharacterized membrane protein YdjX (TVP38/TMEM64 family)